MDVWRSTDTRLWVRFWSHSKDVEWESYEVVGIIPPPASVDEKHKEFDEGWVPEAIRDEYDNWFVAEMPFRT